MQNKARVNIMTNEEWIKSQPTEIFATYLTCKGCYREHEDEEQEKCFAPNCTDEQIKWLKAVHHD